MMTHINQGASEEICSKNGSPTGDSMDGKHPAPSSQRPARKFAMHHRRRRFGCIVHAYARSVSRRFAPRRGFL